MIDSTLPLLDLHRHLDGSIRLETVLELAQEHGIKLPANDVEGLRPHVQVAEAESGLMEFIEKFRYLTEVLVNCDACCRVARENVEDAHNEGIDYIELRFSPGFMAERHGLDKSEVVAAIIDGAQAGQNASGTRVNLIGILSRTYGKKACQEELEALLDNRDGLVAIDLAGDEVNYPAKLYSTHFRQVRDAGLDVTVHAGEADGPESVWSAIRDLGATRIGHGFRSIEDPELVQYLARNDIGLEVCLTSNLHIGAITDYARHPVRKLMEQGVRANLNTDDPGISGIDLKHEYEHAAPRAGLSTDMIRKMQRNSVEMAFLTPREKQELLDNQTGRSGSFSG
jgi:adenosine deaminase